MGRDNLASHCEQKILRVRKMMMVCQVNRRRIICYRFNVRHYYYRYHCYYYYYYYISIKQRVASASVQYIACFTAFYKQ
jgi:hypothetical protein